MPRPLVAAAGAALLLAASPALAAVTATTDGVDTVTITSNAAGDVMTMTCFVGQATVNGNLALPVMGCQDVTFVEVDANGGTDTVDLGGVTQLAFPVLDQTSVDVEDSSADSVTGSESRDVVHADNADTVSTGVGDDWVEGAGTASGGEGNDTLRQISGSVQGGSGDDLIVTPGRAPSTAAAASTPSWSTSRSSPARWRWGSRITDASINGFDRHLRYRGVRRHVVRRRGGGRRRQRFYSGRVSFHSRAGNDTFFGGPGADVADLGPATTWSTPAPAPTSSWLATATTRSRLATGSATWWSAARATTRSPPTGPTC